MTMGAPERRLGLGANWRQFALLVLVNAFVGAMVGLERSILPGSPSRNSNSSLAPRSCRSSRCSGSAKALTNYLAGRLSEDVGRKPVLVAGWLVAVPVPFLLMWAPTWGWVLLANVLLGVSQGLTWSTTVIMKIDLAGPGRRGLAMGLNEFAGYLAVALSALATGSSPPASACGHSRSARRLFVAAGLFLSAALVRETRGHAQQEARGQRGAAAPSQREIFARTSLRDRDLSAVSQAGLVNNLNDGMAGGSSRCSSRRAGMSLRRSAWLAAIYPAVWGVGQLFTGALSDRIGRKWLIACGMWVQALGIALVAAASTFVGFAFGCILLGLGTAMVYPTLLAAIGDVAPPSWRASAVGVYRLWRDLGYAAGALLAGIAADRLGLRPAILAVAALTLASGVLVAARLRETAFTFLESGLPSPASQAAR